MKNRKVAFISVLMISFLILGVFANGQQENGDNSSDKPYSGTTLTIASSQNWIKDIDREIAEDFTAETGIIVDYQVNPDSQYPQILQTKIITGEGTDIFYSQAGLALKKLPLNKVLDLSNEPWVKRMKQWAVNGATIDGRMLGLNLWSVDGWAFVYNTQLFDELNLEAPNNFEELLVVCEVIKNHGVNPIYEIVGDMWHAPMLLNQVLGAESDKEEGLYDKLNTNQKKLSDIPGMTLALEQLKTLADKGYLGETYMSNTWTNATEAMGTSQYAMFLGYTSWQNEVVKNYPDSGAEEWKMFASPLGTNENTEVFATSAGGIISLITDGPNAEAAKLFFEYRTRPEVLKKFYAARPDVNGNPAFTGVDGNPSQSLVSITEQVDGNFKLDAQGGMLYFDQMAYGSEIQGFLAGAYSAEEALANMDKYRFDIGKSAGQEGFK